MNSSIEEIKDCMFYNLSANKDKPISIYTMWNQLTSGKGYHCSELNELYKSDFITEFHCMPTNYKNIKKIYVNGTPNLIYTELDDWQIKNDEFKLEEKDLQCKLSLEDIIDGYLACEDIITLDNDFILWLVKNNKLDEIKQLFDKFDFNDVISDMLKLSQSNDMTIFLLTKKYKNKINELQNTHNSLKQYNSRLFSDNNELKKKVKNLEYRTNKDRYIMMTLLCGYLLMSLLFFNN